jgi:hypothetical protein
MNPIYTCKYCLKSIERKNKFSESGHLAVCVDWKKWKEINFSYDNLNKLYIVEQHSLPELQEIFGLKSVSSIHKALKRLGFPIRSCKESVPNRDKKIAKTNLARYGDENVLGGKSPVRKRMLEDLYIKYNVGNVFELEYVKDKIKKFWQINYGVDYISQCKEFRDKQLASFQKKYNLISPLQLADFNKGKYRISSIHKKVYQFLIDYDIRCSNEFFLSDGYTKNKYYWFDIHFDEPNLIKLLIEVNGDHVHANPKIYKETDLVDIIYHKNITAKEIWEHDLKKKNFAESMGYKVIYLWESDIRHNFLQVKNDLKSLIKEYYEDNQDPFSKKIGFLSI